LSSELQNALSKIKSLKTFKTIHEFRFQLHMKGFYHLYLFV